MLASPYYHRLCRLPQSSFDIGVGGIGICSTIKQFEHSAFVIPGRSKIRIKPDRLIEALYGFIIFALDAKSKTFSIPCGSIIGG